MLTGIHCIEEEEKMAKNELVMNCIVLDMTLEEAEYVNKNKDRCGCKIV